jgi:hypothetical protein
VEGGDLKQWGKNGILVDGFILEFRDILRPGYDSSRILDKKQSHNIPMEAQGERKYSSYSFTTSALDGGEWSASRLGRDLPSGKGPPVLIGQEVVGISESV